MPPQKALRQRERELQDLLATPAGRKELQELASCYQAASNRWRPSRPSVITFILVCERDEGLITG
jgi:hypothetical protein